MNDNEQSEPNPFLSYVQVLYKHKFIIAAFVVVVLTGTTFWTDQQTKIYQARSEIIIEVEAPQYLPIKGREVVRLGGGSYLQLLKYFETQYRIIRSRPVATRVVEELGLREDLDFMGLMEVTDDEMREEKRLSIDIERLLLGKITIEPYEKSNVVAIVVKDHDAERAARIANAVARVYANQNVDRKISAASEAVTWLNAQAATLGAERDDAERQLLEFKRNQGIIQSTLFEKQDLLGSDLVAARRSLRAAESSRLEIDTRYQNLLETDSKGDISGFKEAAENKLIQNLKGRLVSLKNSRSDLLLKYLEKHPAITAIDEKIARVKSELDKEVRSLQKVLYRELQTARERERSQGTSVQRLEQETKRLQTAELEYRRLEYVAESSKQLQTQILSRLKEAELQVKSRANNVRILEEAKVSMVPIYPRKGLNLAAAFLLALVGGSLLAFVFDYADNSVRSQQDLEVLGLTFLGIIPVHRKNAKKRAQEGLKQTDLCVFDNPKSPAAECIRTVRTNLLFMVPDRELRSIVVTSASPSEGKTFTCVNIGAVMALSGARTLVIDSDLRRPRCHKVFDVRNEKGLTNMVMDNSLSMEDMVYKSEIPGLDLLFTGPLPPNPSELIHTNGFKRTIQRALDEYDRVIFDSPPVCAVTDAQVLGQQVDGAVLVAQASTTNRHMLAKATRLLTSVNVRILGALLNKLDLDSGGYGQYYYYQYYGNPYGSDEEATVSS